jgi:peptidoglycan/LPS O-acetylase OafA/YrhL
MRGSDGSSTGIQDTRAVSPIAGRHCDADVRTASWQDRGVGDATDSMPVTRADDRGPDAAESPRPRFRPRFRPDIQGLRGIAVLLVVLCHAGMGVRGGFIGVDVFFVVSGFVITGELLAELRATGTVRLRDFYARRARRLLPTLTAVIVVTLAVGAVTLNPFGPQTDALRTGLTATGFFANAYLYRHVGYFDSWVYNRNPFLHLWSLSVEEQFYVVLPALLLVVWCLAGRKASVAARRRLLAVVLGVGAACSFVLAWLMTSGRSPVSVQAPVRLAFYGAPTRVWEFAVGALLALAGTAIDRVPRGLALGAGAVGIALVGWWSFALDPAQAFPGLTAVPPVVGAGLLIVGGASSPAVASVLAVRPLRWLGDRSYSLYLWHWPAIVFARQLWPEDAWAPPLAALVALTAAASTYGTFEDRIRRDRRFVGRRALALAAGCTAVSLLGFGLADAGIHAHWGLHEPLGWYDHPYGQDHGCILFNRDLANGWYEDRCVTHVRGSRGLVLVLGDGLADSVTPGVTKAAGSLRLDVAEWARTSCPFLGRAPYGFNRCRAWQVDALDLVDRLHPRAVVIANRAPDYVDDLRDDTTIATGGGGRPVTGTEARRSWIQGLDAILGALARRHVPAIVVQPAPDFRFDFPRDRFSVVRPGVGPVVRTRREVERDRDPIATEQARLLAGRREVQLVDPLQGLCPDGRCATMSGETWLFQDRADLTNAGSYLLAPALLRAIQAATRSA